MTFLFSMAFLEKLNSRKNLFSEISCLLNKVLILTLGSWLESPSWGKCWISLSIESTLINKFALHYYFSIALGIIIIMYVSLVLPLTLLTRISFLGKMLNKSIIWVDTNSSTTTLWVIHSEIWERWGLWQIYRGIFNFINPNFITQGVGVQRGSWQWGTCPFRGRWG